MPIKNHFLGHGLFVGPGHICDVVYKTTLHGYCLIDNLMLAV